MKTDTLKELCSGELRGKKRVKISENLTTFPMEILELAESLEVLDLSHNRLKSIPKEIQRLKKLKIAFFSYNEFRTIPDVFRELDSLYMLGFKGNKIESVEENILPLTISWLILTDNSLKRLPDSIGDLRALRKFPLAGNQLKDLPQTMQKCQNLELLRLSANRFEELPNWLLEMPKLAWLAFSGNPCSKSKRGKIGVVAHKDIEMDELLGEGASGKIYRAHVKSFDKPVAVKLFKGAVTSDGYAKDEMDAYISVGEHKNLIKVLAKIEESHLGLILEYISSEYKNLGFPPNFESCSRDTYDKNVTFKIEEIVKVSQSMISVATHLHREGVMHGDLYAHNILVDSNYDSYLADFGAASFYMKDNQLYEKLEVLAFGNLLEDMLCRCDDKSSKLYRSLDDLRVRCQVSEVSKRPLFREMSV